MSNWFSSDFHGYHKNICRGTSEWDKGPPKVVSGIHGIQSTRDFKTVEEMNEAILKGINDHVKWDDVLYFLGDFTFGGQDKMWRFRRRINCENIHFIFGNHDKAIEHNVVMVDDDNKYVCADDLFLTRGYYKHISLGKQEIIMSHYAFRVWNRSHHGSIMLYGHSHDSLDRGGEEWGKSMDVGIDSAFRRFGEYRPFSEDEILKIMATRPINIVDHHNQHTN